MPKAKKITTAVSKRRLLALAEFLRKLPPKRFEFGVEVSDAWQGKADLSCGATACAMGWSTTMPIFRRLGVRLSEDGSVIIMRKNSIRNSIRGTWGYVSVAEEIFGIPYDDAEWLFTPGLQRHKFNQWGQLSKLPGAGMVSPDMNASAKEVATHIERYVKKMHRLGADDE
jgi:hypothetical protein